MILNNLQTKPSKIKQFSIEILRCVFVNNVQISFSELPSAEYNLYWAELDDKHMRRELRKEVNSAELSQWDHVIKGN